MKRALIAAFVLGSSLSFAGTVMAADTPAAAPAAKMAAAAPAGDAKKGKKVFRKCKACHAVGKNAKNKVGPIQNGVIGRKAGTVAGYKYSKAMKKKSAEGLMWTVDNLDKFLTKPRKFIKKTKMAFSGLKKAKDRANLIAYLATFK